VVNPNDSGSMEDIWGTRWYDSVQIRSVRAASLLGL
jgi:hypothetical protein